MKRSIDSSPGLKPLKRANSSLFSIATIIDDDNNVDSLLDGGLKIEEKSRAPKINGKVRTVSSASDLSPLIDGALDDEPPEAVASSCSDSESDLSNGEIVLCQEVDQVVDSESGTVAATAVLADAETKESGDHRTGLIFESASNHQDRYNKFHKERPMRITSVFDYLSNAKPDEDGRQTIFERCHLLEKNGHESSSEDTFLNDDDYLRVHLPGYMQRCVVSPFLLS